MDPIRSCAVQQLKALSWRLALLQFQTGPPLMETEVTQRRPENDLSVYCCYKLFNHGTHLGFHSGSAFQFSVMHIHYVPEVVFISLGTCIMDT